MKNRTSSAGVKVLHSQRLGEDEDVAMNDSHVTASGNASRSSAPEFNADDYRDCLDGLDLTKEEQDEILGVLWGMMLQIADICFGMDSVQQAVSQRVVSQFAEAASNAQRGTLGQVSCRADFQGSASASAAEGDPPSKPSQYSVSEIKPKP